jgi:hypothetical protein
VVRSNVRVSAGSTQRRGTGQAHAARQETTTRRALRDLRRRRPPPPRLLCRRRRHRGQRRGLQARMRRKTTMSLFSQHLIPGSEDANRGRRFYVPKQPFMAYYAFWSYSIFWTYCAHICHILYFGHIVNIGHMLNIIIFVFLTY